VEKPFRYGQKIPRAYPIALASIGVLALLGAATARPMLVNAPAETAQDWRAALALTRVDALVEAGHYSEACMFASPCGAPVSGQRNIYIVGDSHARDGYNMLRAVYPDAHIVLATSPGCLPFLGQTRMLGAAEDMRVCRALIDQLYADDTALKQADLIVISGIVQVWFTEALDQSLQELATYRRPILVFGNSPAFKQPLPDIIRVEALTPNDAVPQEFVDPQYLANLEHDIATAAQRSGAHYLSLRDFFCPNGQCATWTEDRTRLISYDEHHLSLAAAQAFGRARADAIRDAAARR
jgi:hypothetical protein